jgi:pimeloyl-ACP methyl ester carboxylesterase
MKSRTDAVEALGGAVPVEVLGPAESRDVPGLVAVPSIFGAADDLFEALATLADRAAEITCPLRFHFGEADPVTPPEAIEKIRAAFDHPDAEFVVHPGLVHGFSHEGTSYDAAAARLGLDAARALLATL